jgi:DNA-binding NarL/FixJ family response regulator
VITVAIVEDNSGLRTTLEKFVARSPDFEIVGCCDTAEEALAKFPALKPNVVLMDINLPGRSGIECTRRLRDVCPDTRVLILTVYDDSENILNALKAGAHGYLLKRATPQEILEAIRDVYDGGAPMSSQIARKVVASFRETKPEQGAETLTERESEVLGFLTKGYSGKEIASRMSVSLNTVKTHLKHIYAKLHVRSRTEILLRFRN